MLFKRRKICYNDTMRNTKNGKNRGSFASLIGEPTPAKTSGLTFTYANVFAISFAYIFFLVLIASGIADTEAYKDSEWYKYCNYLITPLAFAVAAAFIAYWAKIPVKERLKAQNCRPKYYWLAVLLQIGLLCLSELNSLFLEFLAQFGYQDTPIILPSMDGVGFVGVLLAVALLPAVFEEIIFRGLLLKGMRAFGMVGAILISGALFALFHQNPAQTIYQFCCGAAFALVALRSGSILPTVLSHFINNALILTLTKFGITEFTTPVFIAVICTSIICLICSLGYLIFFDKNKPAPLADKAESKQARKHFWLTAALGIALCGITWLSVLLSGM